MQIIYANEPMPLSMTKSLFLAGPSPRSNTAEEFNWRPEALRILQELDYDGVNMDSGRLILGYPENAEKMNYLHWMAEQRNIPIFNSLNSLLQESVNRLDKGFLRVGGECQVPIQIWNTDHFKSWYTSQIKAGNRLDGAKVLLNFLVGPKKDFPIFVGLQVKIWAEKEQKHKDNEIIFMRPDTFNVCAFCKGKDRFHTEILLVKEFRSAVNNAESMIYELPGGSSKNKQDSIIIALHELKEETGLELDKRRLHIYGDKQIAATALTHKAFLFFVELTEEEMQLMKEKEKSGETFGLAEDTEKTYIKVATLKEIMSNNLVDWTNLGMINTVMNLIW